MGLTEHYIGIPKKLICTLRDNQTAIAIYFFIARLYLVMQRPVPLSRQDIRSFDPTLKVGAIKRALDRLLEAGWLLETAGYKGSYTPVWGQRRSTNTPYPWRIGEERLGCPKHLWTSAIRVDQALLDLFMGKFEPHRRHAHIERYFTQPLLSLAAIGAYILIAAELEAEATQELQRWGLVEHGQVQGIPDDAVVLALASQRTSLCGFQLTTAGWRKLGWFGTGPSQSSPDASRVEAAPLIFVPKERIGSLIARPIGESIGCAPSSEREKSAAGSAQTALMRDIANIPRIATDSNDPKDSPPNPPTRIQGGGGILSEKENDREIERPDTEAARALFAFGVNDPDCVAELATTPIEQVGRAIAYAEAEDLGPGWVVTALRRHRDDGWPIPQVRRRRGGGGEIDVASVLNGAYGDLFRLGSDTSDLPPFGRSSLVGMPERSSAAPAPQRAHMEPPRPPITAPGAAPRSAPVRYSAAELTQELRSRLLLGCDRVYHTTIRGLVVRLADDRTMIHCASLADRMRVLEALMGAVRAHVAELGLPTTIRITDAPVPPEEQARAVGQALGGVSSTA